MNKIKVFSKSLIVLIMLILFVFHSFAAQTAVFIMYHRFGEPQYPSTNISLSQFDAQLKLLKTGGYHVLPVPEIVKRLRSHRALPDKTVGIIIDDAYDSAYHLAWPRLQRYHFPFTLFVATDPIDKAYADIMTWQELKILAKAGVTIGNHSASHNHLAAENIDKATLDIQRAQRRIQQELNVTPNLFAYPYGEYNLPLQQAVKKLGFDAAFMQVSGASGFASDWYALPRFALNEFYGDLDRFRLITQTLPIAIKNLNPANPILNNNPPRVIFTVINKNINLNKLTCFASEQGRVQVYLLPSQQVAINLMRAFAPGPTRINCTLLTKQGRYRWLGLYYEALH